MDELSAVVARAAQVPVADLLEHREVATQGDVSWVLFRLRDGRWALTDDAELAQDRVALFATREEAMAELEAAAAIAEEQGVPLLLR